jgi:hypothetical protein
VLGRLYLAAFLGDPAAFLAALGLAAFFAAGFLADADLAFFGADAFLTLGAVAALAGFFAGVAADGALFFAATGLAVVALLFGFTCRDFVAVLFALVELADLGFELERALVGLAALAFLGFAAVDVAVLDVTAVEVDELPVATFLADLGPADFDAERFLVPDADDALELDALFLVFLVDDDFFFLTTGDSPSLNEPLAPLPLVCLKCLALTPFFNANFKC